MSLQLTEDDEFIVLANAAFWACTSHEEVVAHVQHIGDAKMAASKLRDMVLAYGNKEEVSIIVIHLSDSGQFTSHHASVSGDEDSPLVHHYTKRTTTSKLSRPKTFHGESDLHFNTASLGRTKQDTTTHVMNPSIEHGHSKSVKVLYSKPAAQVEQQPEVISPPPPDDDSHVNTLKDNSSQEVEVKKKPQNDVEWTTPKESGTNNHHKQTFSIGSESNPPVKQTPVAQSQFKTSYDNPVSQPVISHDPQPVISHDPQLVASHDPQPLASRDPQPVVSPGFRSLSHSSSYSTITDHDSTGAQSLNESANPTWFESLPPIEFGDSFGDDTFGLELDMISRVPNFSDSNVVLGKRNVDQGWGTRTRSYTQPASSMRNTDREQAKANFNFDELLAGLSNTWMTVMPSFPENNDSKNEHVPAAKSTMKQEDSLFLDNLTLMEQFDQPSGDQDEELNDLISQLSNFASNTS